MPRYLYLPDGRTVETPDNAAVDALLADQRRGRIVALIHALETHSRAAAGATLLLVAAVGVTLWWGLPVLAHRVAMAVPDRIEQQAGRTALATINQWFGPTALNNANRKRVMAQVERLAKAGNLTAKPEVVFRTMGLENPNAFALPGGVIVMSDELVEMATDGELAAVLAHEIGHWQHRHGMQSVLRGSAALLFVSAVTGDLSALTSFAGTLPLILLQRGYSREFETEADAYAVDLMRKARVELRHFESILLKLGTGELDRRKDISYLSTHPGTIERINRIKAAGGGAKALSPPEDATASDDDAGSRTESNLTAPEAVSRTLPQYPADLVETRLPGHVMVEFVVDLDGNVRDARVLSSSRKEFEPSALAAIERWKFNPGRRHGRPVALKTILVLEFNPDNPAGPPALPVESKRPEVGMQLTFASVDTLPEPLAEPLPRYPAQLRNTRVSGTVMMNIIVAEDGDVRVRHVVKSSHQDFEAAARDALAAWKYRPGKKAGQVIATNGVVVFNFLPNDE